MEDPSNRSWDEIFWSWMRPQDRLLGWPDKVPGVGFPPGRVPLESSEGPAMFHNHSISKTLAPGTCCELDRFHPRHQWRGLSHTGKGQRCPSLLPTPIWLFVVDWVKGYGHGGRVFCKWMCSPRKSWCLMIAFSVPSAACLGKKRILREERIFVTQLKV